MGKRNKKKLRPHQIPDEEFEALEKPDVDGEEQEAPVSLRPPKAKTFAPRGDLPYREGDVVKVPNKHSVRPGEEFVTGAVYLISGQEYHVLDSVGVIHRAYVSEVTPIQKSS